MRFGLQVILTFVVATTNVQVLLATAARNSTVVAKTFRENTPDVAKDSLRAAWAGSFRTDTSFPLLHVHLCLGCLDPNLEGSLGERLTCFFATMVPPHLIPDYESIEGSACIVVFHEWRSLDPSRVGHTIEPSSKEDTAG